MQFPPSNNLKNEGLALSHQKYQDWHNLYLAADDRLDI